MQKYVLMIWFLFSMRYLKLIEAAKTNRGEAEQQGNSYNRRRVIGRSIAGTRRGAPCRDFDGHFLVYGATPILMSRLVSAPLRQGTDGSQKVSKGTKATTRGRL